MCTFDAIRPTWEAVMDSMPDPNDLESAAVYVEDSMPEMAQRLRQSAQRVDDLKRAARAGQP